MSAGQEPAKRGDGLTIYINGSEYQLLKKIASKDQLLDLADLDAKKNGIFLLDEHGKKLEIENDEGVELKGGMRFLTRQESHA